MRVSSKLNQYYQIAVIMSLSTICPKCDSTYSTLNPPKALINCPHILCHNCLLTQILCPIDHKRIQRRKYTIQKFSIHQQTLSLCTTQPQQPQAPNIVINVHDCQPAKVQNETKIEKSQEEIKENEVSASQPLSQSMAEEQLPRELSGVNRAMSQQNIEYDNCLLHSKSAELVCMEDRCFICPSCALFGQHKHHKVLSFQSFVMNFGNLAQQCLSIKKQLSERQEKLNIQRLRTQMEEQVKEKREAEVKNVKEYVNTIIKSIRQEQTKIIKNLQDLFKAKQTKIMSYIQENNVYEKIRQYEDTVQTLSNGLLELLKLERIQQYVDFVDQNHSKSYSAKEGEYLLMEVDTNYKTLKKHISNEIAQIKVQKPQNKIQVLKNYINIVSKDIQPLCAESKKAKKSPQPKKKDVVDKPAKKEEQTESKTPILVKNNDEQMLINSVERSKQMNINNNSLSPIAPVGSFQYVIDSHFCAQLGGKTSRPNDFIEMSQIKLPGINLHSRNTMSGTIGKITLLNPTKRDDRRENQSASLARSNHFSKNKSFNSSNQTEKELLNILTDKNEVKKKKKIDLPQKYMKIYDELQKDNLDVLDLGGAFLGDTLVFKISEIIPTRNKLKTVKFMNNKITDEIFPELLIRCTNVNTLNLSYNNLTEKSLDFIEQEADNLGHLTNITLSNNKIVLRSVKERLEMLRKKGVKISL